MSNKRNVVLINCTDYFIPDKDKVYNTVVSPETHTYKRSKLRGYQSRLYWEYKYCISHNGQVFFYTLTYNNKSLPKFEGFNCFDYNDLAHFLNGGFKKLLLRKYGTNFKYFVGAELGTGQGSRGLENNPHYHILFFLRPDSSGKFPYVKIDPFEFRTLVKRYWQGFDENIDGYISYKQAKFGIAKEGRNLGLLDSFAACLYCAKYCTKDVAIKRNEKKIKIALFNRLTEEYKNSDTVKVDFVKESFDDERLTSFVDEFDLQVVNSQLEKFDNQNRLNFYIDVLVKQSLHEKMNEYKNRFSNKVRISQGVGDYALQFVNKKNPYIELPVNGELKFFPPCLYFYRKLFTKVVKNPYGRNIRILNKYGIDYKCSKLESRINDQSGRIRSLVPAISAGHYDNLFTHPELLTLKQIDDETIKRYSIFKMVYENRFYAPDFDSKSSFVVSPVLDFRADYRRFISPSFNSVGYCPGLVINFLENNYKGYIPYNSHPYFYSYYCSFALLDKLLEYIFIKKDDNEEKRYNEIEKIRKFHNRPIMQHYFKPFKIFN